MTLLASNREVTLWALIKRINRRLKKAKQVLRAQRGGATRLSAPGGAGAFYVLDWYRNRVIATHVDPERLGRDLGVLEPSEYLSWT